MWGGVIGAQPPNAEARAGERSERDRRARSGRASAREEEAAAVRACEVARDALGRVAGERHLGRAVGEEVERAQAELIGAELRLRTAQLALGYLRDRG